MNNKELEQSDEKLKLRTVNTIGFHTRVSQMNRATSYTKVLKLFLCYIRAQ